MPQGLVKNNPANDPDKKPVKSRSHFKPNVSVFQTARFGECTPFYAAEVVPDDQNFSVRSTSDVDTLTLKAPMMGPVRMNKDYFFAPLRAILPNNADLLTTNPLTGDDVVAKAVNCIFESGYISRVNGDHGPLAVGQFVNVQSPSAQLLNSGQVSNPTSDDLTKFIGWFFTWYRLNWYLLSEGSLARNLGFNWHQAFIGPRRTSFSKRLSFDEVVEIYIDWIRQNCSSMACTLYTGVVTSGSSNTPTLTNQSFVVSFSENPQSDDNTYISLRQFLYLLQQGCVLQSVVSVSLLPGKSLSDVLPFNPAGFNIGFTFDIGTFRDRTVQNPISGERPYNISRIVAYQIACMQFYTTDSIDYVYSTDLWHKNMLSLARASSTSWNTRYCYTLNGVSIPYDSVSAYIIFEVMNNLENPFSSNNYLTSDPYFRLGSTTSVLRCVAAQFYFANLFGFNRSLKYRDYFVGAKVRPMAVGNVDVTVTGGQFSVVDVTENIQRQRFLNQVNRVGRTLKEYVRGIFGTTPMPDPHECAFLGSTSDIIGAEETQNTGDRQFSEFSMTSRLRTDSSRFAFEGSFSEFGVVIGIMTFDVARPYVNNADAALSHVDRFDMFNPYMQTIGDQAVLGTEVDFQQNNTNFGYQLRYMEYRQRTDFAAGGFHHYLPGYAFIADDQDIAQPGSSDIMITPDFIRSRSYEFDKLYYALPNFSPAGYFHFVIRHDMEVNIDRPMLAAPSIL